MKNQETTLKNHGNQPKPWKTMKLPWKTMLTNQRNVKNYETTLKNHEKATLKNMKKTWNYPENYETTLKNNENQPRILKKTLKFLEKPWKYLDHFSWQTRTWCPFQWPVVSQNWQLSGKHFSWQTDFFFVAKMIIFPDRHTQAVRTSIEYRSPPSSSSSWKLGCQAVRK